LSNFALSIHTETSRGQGGGEELASEPALHSELLQGLCALQSGGDGRAKSLKDGVIHTSGGGGMHSSYRAGQHCWL